MGQRVLALGECMVELAPAGNGLYRRGFAGDTYNFAWYLRRLLPPAWSVGYGTCIGIDSLSDKMLAAFEAAAIDTAAVRRVPDRTVGLYMIELRDGERSFTYWRSHSAARLLAADAAWLDGALGAAHLVLFSGITLAVVLPEHRQALLASLAAARGRGTVIAFDPNLRPLLWPDPATMRASLTEAAGVADILLPSFEDEQAHFGDQAPRDTLARYRRLGARSVIVKNGSREIVAWDEREGEAVCLPPRVEPVDTTAAGDSFNSAFLAARLQGAGFAEANEQGAALAAAVIRHPGALVGDAVEKLRASRAPRPSD